MTEASDSEVGGRRTSDWYGARDEMMDTDGGGEDDEGLALNTIFTVSLQKSFLSLYSSV